MMGTGPAPSPLFRLAARYGGIQGANKGDGASPVPLVVLSPRRAQYVNVVTVVPEPSPPASPAPVKVPVNVCGF